MSIEALRPWGALALGGSSWSIRSVLDPDAVTGVVAAAVESGVRLFDTARAYATVDDGAHNERLLGRALRQVDPEGAAVVLTKGGHFRIDAATWGIDATPEALRADCEASLRALGRERIDIYVLHKPDPRVPLEESVGALDALRDEGLVGAIGVSNVDGDQLERALAVAPQAVVENRFSPFDQRDAETIRRCERLGIPYVAYSSTGGRSRPGEAGGFARTRRIAERAGIGVYPVWLAWLRRYSPAITPLIGATRPESVRDSAQRADDLLDDADWAVVDDEIGSAALAAESAIS